MASRVVQLRPPVPAHAVERLFAPPPEPTDEALVARARGGDRAAEEALYRRYARYVGSLGARLLGDPSDGEDVMQQTFCIALNRLGELRDPAAFRPWIASIAVSQARWVLRRRKLFDFFGGATHEGLADLAVAGASSETRTELAMLSTALDKLPANERIAWTLRFVEGHALEEIAELTKCSLATVKRRIDAAKKRVNAHIGGGDE